MTLKKSVFVKKIEPPKCACGALADHYVTYLDPNTAHYYTGPYGKPMREPKFSQPSCEACLLKTFVQMLNVLDLKEQAQ